MRAAILVCSFIFLPPSFCCSQIIPNGDFEEWATNAPPYQTEDPVHWLTTNPNRSMIGLPPNAIKETQAQSGQYALKLQAVHASMGNNISGTAVTGITLNFKPTHLPGYHRSDINGSESPGIGFIV